MRIKIIFLLTLAISMCNAYAAAFSETNNGIYIAISGSSTNESVEYNDSLAWRPFCDHQIDEAELNYPDRAYGIKIMMLDAFGKKVPKTKLGEVFGIRFDELHTYKDVAQVPSIGYSDSHIGSIRAQGQYDGTDAVSGPLLPSPKELFQIDNPGTYTLEIQMQMFLIHKNTNQWTRQLIRFSPIKIKVEKPQNDDSREKLQN